MKLILPLFIMFSLWWLPASFSQAVNKQQLHNNNTLQVTSARQAARMVKQRSGGKVLKVKSFNKGYLVRILKGNGKVIQVFVNAQTGQMTRR